MSADSFDELRAQRLRQRLWGATIIIALAVIFLPLLLDGSGSESQFRRVERLREEPPRVINEDGTRETVTVPQSTIADQDSWWSRTKRRFTESPVDAREAKAPQVNTLEEEIEIIDGTSAEFQDGTNTDAAANSEPNRLQAWVVQAGSFADQSNAIAVRDRLRRAGYPSFVTPNADGVVFRVRVGPMINRSQAADVREKVISILGREALVVPYP